MLIDCVGIGGSKKPMVSAKLVEHGYFEIWEILIKNTKDKKTNPDTSLF